MSSHRLLCVLCCLALVSIASALKCYVCKDQEHNTGKCLRTVKICDYGQDRCLTDVKWGSVPYWSEGVEMQYYVSKSCSNQSYCDDLRRRYLSTCERIWYEDWKCMDCCQGDLCNYYVTLSASNAWVNPLLLAISLTVAMVNAFWK